MSLLTLAQLLVLKTDILANPAFADLTGPDGSAAIADYYNVIHTPDYFVWKTMMSTQDIYDQINWANLTPNDVPDGTQLWMNRSLACQGKQFNIQTLLTGRETINPSKINIRVGLQDSLTNIPSGNSGALRNAGWAALQTVMSRKATRAERLLATGTGTQGSPGTMTFEGVLTYMDVEAARVAV